jgi:hypothetical protein
VRRSVPLACRNLHEHTASASPHSSSPSARGGACQWLLAKRVINPQLVANIPFSGEAGFTWDVWENDNPHTTVASKHHRFSTNIWVGILGDQLLGEVFLPNRLTGSVYHLFFFVNDYQHFWNMCLFINDTCGSCTTSCSPHCEAAPEPDSR